MNGVCIMQGTHTFRLWSYGNGLAYSLANWKSGSTIYVQGDDAAQFRNEIEALENAHPDWDVDRVLGEMWHTYEALEE